MYVLAQASLACFMEEIPNHATVDIIYVPAGIGAPMQVHVRVCMCSCSYTCAVRFASSLQVYLPCHMQYEGLDMYSNDTAECGYGLFLE